MSRKRKRKQQRSRLEELQAEAHQAATTWWKAQGVDLDFLGVDLGRCLEYPMLEAINSITKQEMKGRSDDAVL